MHHADETVERRLGRDSASSLLSDLEAMPDDAMIPIRFIRQRLGALTNRATVEREPTTFLMRTGVHLLPSVP